MGQMDDLLVEFIAETRDMLDALGGEIVAWEAEPGDRARLDEIFRFVHTVKGNCGFFDLPRIRALSHAAEDVLADLRSGKRLADHRLVGAVLAIIDRIGELIQELESGECLVSGDDEQLIAQLQEGKVGSASGGPEEVAVLASTRATMRSIRLPVDLLDRMMSGVSDLVLARNELARSLRENDCGTEVEAAFERVSGTIGEMRDAITHTRMQRIDNLFAALPRLVRDIADQLGKNVKFQVDGGDVELDREMIEMIRDPLAHMIRNAIDHGIEDEVERKEAGKPAIGQLLVTARQAGNQILIEIIDDGRGIDGDNICAKAVASGLITKARADRLSAPQKCALIFEPGLSTAANVTDISGRGVGMDVVRANVERIGGLIDIDNREHEGLRLTLRVPLTLTIIPALTVKVGGQSYAIPRASIQEIVRVRGDAVAIDRLGGALISSIRGRRLPFVSLGDALGIEHEVERSDQCLIVLKPAGCGLYSLAVDHVCDHEELVVKPAAPAIMATGLYAGTTLADDGVPILLLDPPGIAARSGVAPGEDDLESLSGTADPTAHEEGQPALLFNSLSGTKKVVPLTAVERVEDIISQDIQLSAGRVHISLDETVVPLLGCGAEIPQQPVRILRLSDGVSHVAYGFSEVIDIVNRGKDIQPAAVRGEVRGVTLIGGEQVEVIDLFHLFETAGLPSERDPYRRICTLPAGNVWMDTFLRPLVESVGYQVIGAGDAGSDEAELHIVDADEAMLPSGITGRILRIRSSMSDGSSPDDSIYRYDRDALLEALGAPVARRKS